MIDQADTTELIDPGPDPAPPGTITRPGSCGEALADEADARAAARDASAGRLDLDGGRTLDAPPSSIPEWRPEEISILKKPTKLKGEKEKQIIEWIKTQNSFDYFLESVHILVPPTKKMAGGVVPFERWPHLMELKEVLLKERLVVVLKARQIGVSWLLAAYALWVALFHKGANVLMLSKGEDEASKLLGKAKFIFRELPAYLRTTVNPDSTQEMGFPVVASVIKALPATKNAGRSEAATLIIVDEHDYHPFAAENYGALKPTIDAGGQLVSVSTSNKLKATSIFKSLYTQGRAGENNFKSLFYPWHVRPGRTTEWYEDQRREYSSEPYLLEQEYPNTDDEALAPAQALAAFNAAILNGMRQYLKKPIEVKGMARIYYAPVVGAHYTAGTDTSHGVGKDRAVTVVTDVQRGIVVADIVSAVLPPDALAHESYRLLEMYGFPLWAIEDNDWGILTIKTAQRLGYKNLFYRDWIKDKSKRDNVGWHTDHDNHFQLWGDYIETFNAGNFIVPNEEGLGQHYSIIRNPDKMGKIEAMEGAHDDYPMACALSWYIRRFVRYGQEARVQQIAF